MLGALDLIYMFLLLNALNEHVMLPRDAGDNLLFRILQDELGIVLEQKPMVGIPIAQIS